MTAKLNFTIESSNYELVRDRIAIILREEIDNQAYLQGIKIDPLNVNRIAIDEDLDTQVYIERYVPIEKSEINVISVKIASIGLSDNTPISQVAKATFFIDVFTNGIESDATEGYKDSSLRLHKLCRIIRSVIQNPQYIRLGFAPSFIQSRKIENIQFADVSDNGDAMYSRMARITLTVDIFEEQTGITPTASDGFDTVIKFGETEKGIKLIYNT